MKSNLTKDVVSHERLQIDLSLLTYYCYNILSRIVCLFRLSLSRLWSDVVL